MSEFLASYDLMSETMDVRYQTKAAEYYRKKLRAFANDEEFTQEKPDYEEGRAAIEYRVKSQEELKEAISGGAKSGNGDNVDKAKEFMNEFWSGTKNMASKGYNITKEGAIKVNGKLEESGVTQKVKGGAVAVGSKTAEYGGIAYNKTKDGIASIAANEKVQEYSSKAYTGAKQATNAVWGFFSQALNNNDAGSAGASGNGTEGGMGGGQPNPSSDGGAKPDYSPGT